MCEPASIGLLLGASASSAAAVGTMAYIGAGTMAAQAYTAHQAAGAQEDATNQARDAATKQADQADQANNRANGKQPDVNGLSSANSMAAKGGQSGTMLTGATGVDPKTLLLGKSTLLGS